MVDGLVEVAVFSEPYRCGAVKLSDPVGAVPFESVAQKFGEDVMEAEPIRVVVDPLQEESALLDLFQHRLPVRRTRQHGGQLSAGALGDRCRLQKIAHIEFDGVEYVFGQ